jgi:hypothetical protein
MTKAIVEFAIMLAAQAILALLAHAVVKKDTQIAMVIASISVSIL